MNHKQEVRDWLKNNKCSAEEIAAIPKFRTYICEKHGETDADITFSFDHKRTSHIFCMQCISELLTKSIGEMKIKEVKAMTDEELEELQLEMMRNKCKQEKDND